tara:strand:- start:345 stop:788 length:444 start_codon:yes stop_codon:yes gene_type:complete
VDDLTDISNIKQSVNRSLKWVSRAGLRPTKQRIKLAQLLIGDGQNKHITAESLFELVKKSDVSVSLATVYNTLKAFCDVGLINEVMVDGGKSYFDTRLDDHPHFFWEDTGQISDAPSEALEINNLPTAPNEYEITKIDVIIRLKLSK